MVSLSQIKQLSPQANCAVSNLGIPMVSPVMLSSQADTCPQEARGS